MKICTHTNCKVSYNCKIHASNVELNEINIPVNFGDIKCYKPIKDISKPSNQCIKLVKGFKEHIKRYPPFTNKRDIKNEFCQLENIDISYLNTCINRFMCYYYHRKKLFLGFGKEKGHI